MRAVSENGLVRFGLIDLPMSLNQLLPIEKKFTKTTTTTITITGSRKQQKNEKETEKINPVQ